MKGKKKRNKFKVGNQAFLSRYDSLATNQDCNGVAPSTAPSTQVLKNSSMQVSSASSKSEFTNSTTNVLPKKPTESLWLPRLTEKDFKLYSKESYDKKSYVAPQTEKCATTVKLLRPHKVSDDYLDEYLGDTNTENRTVDRDLNILMMNNLIICHINESPHCNVPHFELVQETQWGLGWIWELKCTKCKFISEKYKLFREIETGRPGRKSASINYGFQTGVINSNIGNDSARVLLTSSCIPPMARTTMQRITNNVCDKVVKLANEETKKVVENFKRRNETLGLNKNSPIKLQMDGTYQSVYIKSRHKMGQTASQAIGIACENETDSHDVIGLHLINKLCWVGAWLRGKGYDVECPNHEHCTANTNRYDPLSEKDLGYEIGKKIATNELLVDYCTTDGDAKSVKGLQEAMQEVFGPLWSVNRLADTIHRGQSQFREGIRANFSVGMFPGVTKAQKNDIKTAFANDIKLRSHGIMKSLFMKYNGDRQQISKCLPGIVRSVVNCYSGNCGDTCRWSITLCNGGKKTSWWYKSINLNSHGLQNGSLIPTDRDKLLIESLLEMKLSQSALDQMKFFSNTNKCESVNRTISTYLPKNKNFSRNAIGRASAAVLKVNNNRDVALVKTLKAVGCTMGKKSRAAVALKKIRKLEMYDSAYQKSSKVKYRRLQARKRQAINFLLHKSNRNDGYKKHQLEPKLSQLTNCKEFVPQPGCSFWPD
ncbi:unnamed protein product [Mytilus edulis]|uniref:Mutator-like transposase domain-containing protein n=1 Tax=Mytilus edulis TaxID=6550 RepID=A0A8S3Q6Q0_MYTED|nr:unnamed protein product [Mytilus edulis]